LLVSVLPEAGEGGLLSSFDFYFDVSRLNWFERLYKNLAVYGVAWFIEWKLRLNLNSAFLEVAPSI
jgi:hypothetical protein